MDNHMLNRANARLRIVHKDGDYATFERALAEALEQVPGMRLVSNCLMRNRGHLLLWPHGNGELSAFGHYLILTHKVEVLRQCVQRGRPYGNDAWTANAAR